MRVTYESNNSGGGWWLKDKDWIALEAAGWFVEWGRLYFCHSQYSFNKIPVGKPEPCADKDKCPGHRCFDSIDEMTKKDYWLGAVAKSAHKDFPDPRSAIDEWAKITGKDPENDGCNCCGPPHSFSWEGGYASGSDIMDVRGFELVRVPKKRKIVKRKK